MLTELALGRDALDTDAAVAAFLQHAQERGFVRVDEIEALQQEFELDEEAINALHTALEDADVEIEEAAGEESAQPELDLTPSTPTTTDSLQLFLNGIGRYKLLTADEEVELAKRIERGDLQAKERMINSNLRLVVHIARRYTGHGVPLGDLIQEGVIGLNRAAEKFDWRKGFKF
jgi:RNA polymerase primary sigma factor